MRKFLFAVFAALAFIIPVFAQMGGGAGPGAGNFDNGMEKLYGSNQVFSATMLTSFGDPPLTAKAKMVFDHENSWTEMNMSDLQGSNLPPQAIEAAKQMKSIGMDEVVSIATADKKNVYLIYPKIRSYVSMAIPPSTNYFKLQSTKVGNETVDGHHCVKNDVTISNGDQSQDFTVWNATDLNNFPIRIALSDHGNPISISYQNISFDKPAAGLFQPPAHYTRYANPMDLMQSAEMNSPGAMPGTPSP